MLWIGRGRTALRALQGVNSSWQQLPRKTSVFSVWQSGSLVCSETARGGSE